MLGNFLTSLIAGIVVYVTLLVTGVPFPVLWALWVALVDFLPMIGGALAGIPTVLFAPTHSLTAGIITLVVFLTYTQLENHVLNPVVMSRTVKVSPLLVLLSILIGASSATGWAGPSARSSRPGGHPGGRCAPGDVRECGWSPPPVPGAPAGRNGRSGWARRARVGPPVRGPPGRWNLPPAPGTSRASSRIGSTCRPNRTRPVPPGLRPRRTGGTAVAEQQLCRGPA